MLFSSRSLVEVKFALDGTQSHYNLLFKSQPMQNALLVSLQSLVAWCPQIFNNQTSFQLALLGTAWYLSRYSQWRSEQALTRCSLSTLGQITQFSRCPGQALLLDRVHFYYWRPSPQYCHFATLYQFALRLVGIFVWFSFLYMKGKKKIHIFILTIYCPNPKRVNL